MRHSDWAIQSELQRCTLDKTVLEIYNDSTHCVTDTD